MKKIKTINKLLSSLTLLSPLAGIGFNNQYQNTQKVITENSNNSLNNYVANQTNAQRTMGDVTVTVDGSKITGFVSSTGEKKLIVDSDITEIGNNAFENQSTNIDYLDLSHATSLTIIGDNAFQSSAKFSQYPDYQLIIPASVTNIGNKAFFDGSLQWGCDIIFLSETPPEFGTDWISINNFPLSTNFVYVPSEEAKQAYLSADNFNINYNNVLVQGTTLVDKQLGSLTVTIKSYKNSISIFKYVSGTGDLTVDSDITEISEGVFASNDNITSLNLSQATSLTTIADEAFSGCQNLTGDLIIPSSVTTIGNNAFQSCSNLTGDLVISSKVTSIGNNAFEGTNITSLDLSQATSLTTIESCSFSGTELSGNLVIPSNVTSIGNSAFNSTNITSLDLSNATSLTTIGQSAFDACLNLTGNLVIPSSVTSIESSAFKYADITSLDLSQATNLTSIGGSAFSGCKNISGDLVISSSITNIGNNAFNNVNKIENIYFTSENIPTFGTFWQPTVTGKVYVPSEQAKQAYLSAENFGFTEDQIEIIGVSGKALVNIDEKSAGSEQYTTIAGFSATKWEIVMTEGEKPEWLTITNQGLLFWTEKSSPGIYKFKIKATNDSQTSVESTPITFIVNALPKPDISNIPLILGLTFGLGIPIILAVGFAIWHLAKKKKTTVKI